MDKQDRIFVAGHQGLIGSAIARRLERDGYTNVITRTRAELDLKDQSQVSAFFEKEKIDFVFFAAARIGGIFANNAYRAEFIYENLLMEANVIHNAFINEVKKLVFFASADVYPRACPQPAKEEYLLSGELESTCEPFAIAKIAGIKLCESYNRQYGTDFVVVIPPNVYGPNQRYDVMNSQVLPSLIKKIHEARTTGADEVVIWGSGEPVRDFLFADDVADASMFLVNDYTGNDVFNIGTGAGTSIKELTEAIKGAVGYTGRITFDRTRPDGVAKKLLDVSKINAFGWTHRTSLADGASLTYESFLKEMERSKVRTLKVSKIEPSPKDADVIGERNKPVSTPGQPATYKNTVVIKPWGHEFLMFENECTAVWFLYIKSGHSTSMHCHPRKKTSLILLNGRAMSNTFRNRRFIKAGDALIMEKGVFHSTKALSGEGICILEIETPPDKTDLLRLEDRYGRERSGYEGVSEMQTANLEKYDYFSFDEPPSFERHSFSKGKFSISFEVFADDDEFKKHFKSRDNELYTSLRGTVLDRNGAAVLDTGDTQNSNAFTIAGGLRIPGKAVILKTMTRE